MVLLQGPTVHQDRLQALRLTRMTVYRLRTVQGVPDPWEALHRERCAGALCARDARCG